MDTNNNGLTFSARLLSPTHLVDTSSICHHTVKPHKLELQFSSGLHYSISYAFRLISLDSPQICPCKRKRRKSRSGSNSNDNSNNNHKNNDKSNSHSAIWRQQYPHSSVHRYMISRVSDQNGVSPLYIMFETHHSGWEPSICYICKCIICVYAWTYMNLLMVWLF